MTAHSPTATPPPADLHASWHPFNAKFGVSSPPTSGPPQVQYSQGFLKPLVSPAPQVPVGKGEDSGTSRCGSDPFWGSTADRRFCLESHSVCCSTGSSKGTSPRRSSLSFVRGSLGPCWLLPFLPLESALSFPQRIVWSSEKTGKGPLKQTSQSLSVNLGACFWEVWYSSSSSSLWPRTQKETHLSKVKDKTLSSGFALKEYVRLLILVNS